jgi:hypothetical protein
MGSQPLNQKAYSLKSRAESTRAGEYSRAFLPSSGKRSALQTLVPSSLILQLVACVHASDECGGGYHLQAASMAEQQAER